MRRFATWRGLLVLLVLCGLRLPLTACMAFLLRLEPQRLFFIFACGGWGRWRRIGECESINLETEVGSAVQHAEACCTAVP